MPYIGNKNIDGVKQKITSLIPQFTTFIEGFAGGAGIAKSIYTGDKNIILIEKNNIQVNVLKKELPRAIVICDCIISYLSEFKFIINPNAVIFLDPPYLFETRHNNTIYYDYELQYSDHVQLLMSLLQLPCNVIIIHPVHYLYDKMLFSWNYKNVTIRYHRKNSLEKIYYNFPYHIARNDYTGQGKNNIDRQRLKRKTFRFVQKLKKMPELERMILLDALRKEKMI